MPSKSSSASIWPLPLGLSLVAGLLMGVAPAPGSAWPLAWVALTPLWFWTQRYPARQVGLLGLVWGLGYHGFAMSWISGLHPLTWMGIPWLASVGITLFAWGFIALWGAALSGVWAGVMTIGQRQPIAFRILLGITLWCSLEWLWMQGPLAWTSLSYTQSPNNLLILHLGQLSGPLVVTAALVAVNGLVAEAWLQTQQRWRLLSVALILVLGLHLLGWGLYSRPLADSPAARLKIGIVQGNIPTRIKLFSEGLRRSLNHYTQGYQQLADQGVDAVLTPEGALPFLWAGPQRTDNSFSRAVRERGVIAWLGTFYPQEGRINQSLLTLTDEGEVFSRYNKIKLVPLGEYIPLENTLGKLVARLSPVEFRMLPGEAQQTMPTPLGQAIAGICFDSAFPQLFRSQAAAGGEFMLMASNNDPYSSIMMAQHHAQDVMRAIEIDRWAVQATNTGYSSVIDPHGNTRWLSGINTYEIHADSIYRRQTRTLYVRWGNWLTPLLMAVTALLGVGQRPKSHSH